VELRFDERGLLPPADYPLTFTELRESVLVVGPGADVDPHWDSAWRSDLVDQAEVLLRQLWDVGITEIFLDGSFVEQKAHPNDIDGYFVCDVHQLASGELQRELNRRDPHKIWDVGPGLEACFTWVREAAVADGAPLPGGALSARRGSDGGSRR